VLTYVEMGSGGSNNNNSIGSSSTIQMASFLVAGIISLVLFILVEKSSASPLFDYSLMSDKRILLATHHNNCRLFNVYRVSDNTRTS
jgi:hypothetical protein